jgi:AcrR family transcriptional regulator
MRKTAQVQALASPADAETDRSLTRAQKAEATQRALIDATVKVVGAHGYADASISRITQEASVAQGTFYNYFDSQQQLFNELLPMLGTELIERIRQSRREHKTPLDKEQAGFETFFEYLLDVPEFYRILNEAETFAPHAHRVHTQNMISGYVRALGRAKAEGFLPHFDEREFEAIAFMLIGIRHYLAMRYTYQPDGLHRPPEWTVETYLKMLRHGLFAEAPQPQRKPALRVVRPMPDAPRLLRVGAADATAELRYAAGRSATADLIGLAEAAAIAAADAADGRPHVLESVALDLIADPRPGRLLAQATLEARARSGPLVNVRITQAGRGDPVVALARLALQARQDTP